MPSDRNPPNNNGSASIELVSKDGPIPINIMMQEGVKALTKILSNQLQEGKHFENADHAMQFVIKNNANKKSPTKEEFQRQVEDLDEEDIVEIDNQSNYHVHSNLTGQDLVLDENAVDKFLEEKFPDPELHINGDEAEIIFDYEQHGLGDVTEGIGKKISEMIESVLPGSFSADVHGRLHAVVNGNELNITEEGISDDDLHRDLYDSNVVNGNGQAAPTYHMAMDDERGEDPGERIGMLESHMDHGPGHNDMMYEHDHDHADGYCPHQHNHDHMDPHGNGKFRNLNYLNFDYNTAKRRSRGKKQSPDFSALLDDKNPMCMYCEYYMVFGEPPKNMIKWYNNTYGYNRLPMSNKHHDRLHNQHTHTH